MSIKRLFPIIAAAALLPLVRFGQTLWSDEAASVWLARLPLSTLLLSLCDPHPAGYYLGLRLWLMGGEAEPWLRLPSLLAGICSAMLVYGLGRDIGGRTALHTAHAALHTAHAAQGKARAGLAALFLVVHPLQVWYAGEVRMYMLSQALGLLSVWLGWRWLDRANRGLPTRLYAVAYWLAVILAFGADYTALFPFVLSQALWLARGRPRPWQWAGLQVVALLAAGALWLHPSQIFALGHTYPATFLAIVLQPLGFGLTPATIGTVVRLTAFMAALGLLAASWQWPRARRLIDRPCFRWLAAAGWVALILFAAFPRLYSLKRQLVVSLPFLALGVAWAVGESPRWLKASLVVISLAISLLLLPQHRREPWNTLITSLRTQVQAGAALWVDELAWTGFDYYARRNQAIRLSQQARPFPDAQQRGIPDDRLAADADVWLVLYNDAYRDLRNLLPLTFRAAYELTGSQQLDGLSVFRYSPRTAPLAAPIIQSAAEDWGLDLLSPLSTCGGVGNNAR